MKSAESGACPLLSFLKLLTRHRQLELTSSFAYEPVWAISTGLTPTPADIAVVHGFIRERLAGRFPGSGEGVRIFYGGSVKPSNARELMAVADVDGALAGGASLNAKEFLAIAGVYA